MRISFAHATRSVTLRLVGGCAGVVALALLATLATAPALAAPHVAGRALHASYVGSDPSANAVVKAAPAVVTIHFAEAVDPAGSAITVYDAKGQVVSQPAHVDANDLKTMQAPMTGDDSEVYLVSWHTVSATDGDPDVGAFNFFVNASGSSELAPKAPTSTPATTATSASGAPAWLVALIGLIGLIVGAVGGVGWARSRVGASGGAR
jgi:methionine-rich copper-binding protein CopC